MLLKKAIHLFPRRPPIVVVPFENQLFTRQRIQELKITQRAFQAHPPRNIACNNDRIRRSYHSAPVIFQPRYIILPARENLH